MERSGWWVRPGPLGGLGWSLAVLVLVDAGPGLGVLGWVVGAALAVAVAALLDAGLARRGRRALAPADLVTSARAGLVVGVAALVADATATGGGWPDAAARATAVALATVALALDAVDGRVARRTGTATRLGARFDQEVDAVLLLVLSVAAAPVVGPWVLAVGAARYLLLAARAAWPRLRGEAPARRWCKVVAAVQGVVLTLVLTGWVPVGLARLLVAVGLGLLAESFGREAWQVWRSGGRAAGSRVPAGVVSRGVGAAAVLLVWAVLVLPDRPAELGPGAALRVPVEALALGALAVLLPPRPGRWVLGGLGALVGALAAVKVLDLAFGLALVRPFDPLADLSHAGSAVGLLRDSVGDRTAALVGAAALGVLVVALVGVPLAALRVRRVASGHRRAALSVLAGLAVLAAGQGIVGVPAGAPVAAASDVRVLAEHARQVRAGLRDRGAFAASIARDPASATPGADLLTALRGKDVVLAFVESYGRVAVDPGTPQGAQVSAVVNPALDSGTRRLAAAGWSARSAFLGSPTSGGLSWLAHSTLQSGLWVDSQPRYDQLLGERRLTLSGAFARAGWRTVSVVPANTRPWPRGRRFYGFAAQYGARDLGYAGPRFGYATMPDQFTLAALRRLELSRPEPVMAEVDLVSSHTPWAPLPRAVDAASLGDGSVFDGQPAHGRSAAQVWRNPAAVRDAYAQSVAYATTALVDFVLSGPDDVVLVLVGDHQPAAVVAGTGARPDVPVSVVTRDRSVLRRVDRWGWDAGLRPSPGAAVWPMDAFRDRFLATFGPDAASWRPRSPG